MVRVNRTCNYYSCSVWQIDDNDTTFAFDYNMAQRKFLALTICGAAFM